MLPPYTQLTPTKSLGSNDRPISPAKDNPALPSEVNCLPPQSPIKFGRRMSNDDAKEITERRRARQSATPTKKIERMESLCQDSKAILGDMAGMFSPGRAEAETAQGPPLNIQMEIAPATSRVKRARGGKDRRDDQRNQGQSRRKRLVNPMKIKQRAIQGGVARNSNSNSGSKAESRDAESYVRAVGD